MTGYMFVLSGYVVSQKAIEQSRVTLSTIEADYMELT